MSRPGLTELTFFWDDLVFLPCAIYQLFPVILAGIFAGMAINRRRLGWSIAIGVISLLVGYLFLVNPIMILVIPSFAEDLSWMWIRVFGVVVVGGFGIRSLMKQSSPKWERATLIGAGLLYLEFGLSLFFGDYRGP